jgi:acetyl esterase/lipase
MPLRHLLQGFAIIAAVMLAGCTRIGLAVANINVDSSAITSVAFDPAHALSLDVFRPENTQSCPGAAPAHPAPAAFAHPCAAPVAVFFYGGSWRNSTREDYRFVGQSLARAGFLVIVPDYRKAPQVAFPAFIEDSARAVAWTKLHAAEYGGDPSRIFLMGHSSGAHMAALLGTDAHFLRAVGMQPRDLAGIVGLAGPYDFLPITDPLIKQAFGPESEWPKSQPVNFVDGDEPPFLLLQGTADKLVWPRNAERLATKLRAQHEPVEVDMIDGASHAGLLVDLLRDASPVRQDVLRFLRTPATADAPPRSPPTR